MATIRFLILSVLTVLCCMDILSVHGYRRRQRRQAVYDENFQQTSFIPENADNSTVLFDLNTRTIGGESPATFTYRVVTNVDSTPNVDGLFVIASNRQLRFGNALSNAERRNYFDYEQFPVIVVIIEATHMSNTQDVRLLRVNLPLSDVNDEPPVVVNQPYPYLATIPVQPALQENVYVIYAEDPDSNADLVYSISEEASQEVKNYFNVEQQMGDDGKPDGHIKVIRRAVFEEGRIFDIPVTIRDRNGIDQVRQTITVNVNVKVGNRVPQFYQDKYEGWIYETDTSDNQVFVAPDKVDQLIVRVHQFQEGIPMTFQIIGDNNKESTFFRITTDGKIFNKAPLDFDIQRNQRPPRMNLYVKVTEIHDSGPSLVSQVPLEIVIHDENDNAPRFQLTQYLKEIREDLEVGQPVLTVLAEDRDSGDNAAVTYELDNPYFSIDNNGVIKVKSPLDFDADPGPTYRFTIIAKDNGAPAQSSSVDVTISTTNVNDEAPVIIADDDIVVKDQVPVGTIITRLRAEDQDGDNVKFYFTPRATQYEMFAIKPSSGLIEVTGPIPKDRDSYNLRITAVDDGSCCGSTRQRSSEAVVVVQITDTVNHKPRFDNCQSYTRTAKVVEESAPGTPVIQVSASDGDRGLNGQVVYTIESPSPLPSEAPFQIDENTGNITVKSRIDRESLSNNYIQVTVKGSDRGVPRQESWCTFRVTITDVNDNDPVFIRSSYNEVIPANAGISMIVTRVAATDADIGENARIVYSLVSGGEGVFDVIGTNGLIELKDKLPPNPGNKKFELLVRAEDSGSNPRSATVKVTITVDLQEQSPPEFESDPTSPTYTYTVSEVVSPENANITTLACKSNYENDPRTQYLLMDEQGELLSAETRYFDQQTFERNGRTYATIYVARELDYKKAQQHKLIVRCQNFGGLTLFDQITLTINVQDKNNKKPYFAGKNSFGRIPGSVSENSEPGILVAEVQGYDDDGLEIYNTLAFTFVNGSNEDDNLALKKLEIRDLGNNKAGIFTTGSFDREVKSSHIITVEANDIRASDLPFHRPIGSPNSATVLVQITITDKNDNGMTFAHNMYNFTVKETASIGKTIATVTADDPDVVDQGRLKYSFETNEDIPFDIKDQTGEIVVTGTLDFEGPKKSYLLTLMARDSDNLFSSTTMVKIEVTDENDNPPVFSMLDYYIRDKVVEEVPYSKDNRLELVQVIATDNDLARNNNMRYRLLGEGTAEGDMQLFDIDSKTGVVYLVNTLDRDEPTGRSEYIFTVEALDEDEDPQKGYANIHVFPLDINDNKPDFGQKRLTGTVKEHSEPGWFRREESTPIAVVLAIDYDFRENATVDYTIDQSPSADDPIDGQIPYFNIDDQGRIFSQVNARYLDREQNAQLELVVRARDRGIVPLENTATVTIILKDINDNSPRFTHRQYNVTMSENQVSGIVTEVHATDDDEEENAELQFSLVNRATSENYFHVETIENKGAISIYNAVDFEKLSPPYEFRLEIKVQDNNASHTDTALVVITVLDYNDNAPSFVNSYQQVNIYENTPPGFNVTRFEAFDADSGINAEFTYLIDRTTDVRREFSIDPNTGEVRTRKRLDREVQSKMRVVIKAVDKGDPQQTGSATLEVNVLDVNDNFPHFKEDYRPVIMENLENGINGVVFPLEVVEIYAVDPDSAQYGPPFGFALPGGCNSLACQFFSLEYDKDGDEGRGTAIIRTSRTFDREVQKYYELPIVMWDMNGKNSDKAMTGTNTLTIIIGDENDNPHFPGHQDIFVYNYEGLFGPLVIGRVYAKDEDDWDLPDKTFTFLSPSGMLSYFSVDKEDGNITMKKGVPENFGYNPYTFSVSVRDRSFNKVVASTVAVIVKDLSDEAVRKAGAFRLTGMTAEMFIHEPENPVTGERSDSVFTRFRRLLADKLGYKGKFAEDHVEIVTLRDGDGYLEVRYAAHGSPYLSPAELDNVVLMNQGEFEQLGFDIQSLPIDECEDEVFEGGCYNELVITGKPVMVNANGTSYVGVESYLKATPGCKNDVYPENNECNGGFCYNDGICEKTSWGSLRCICPTGFDGPRCQQRRHSFDGNSVAFYQTLQQCKVSQTSIEFMTNELNGVILYNGPLINIDPLETPQDFIYLELRDGYPLLMIDHGTGVAILTLDGKNPHTTMMQPLNDGKWHHIDINRNGKNVEMIVDRCKVAGISNGRVNEEDLKACSVKATTPGENEYLNINTYLHLGGIRTSVALNHLGGRQIVGFNGCLRNLIHNKQLYDLHFTPVPGMNTGKNGCPVEDVYCGTDTPRPLCGINGICEKEGPCRCKPMWYGPKCEYSTPVRMFETESIYQWEIKDDLYNRMIVNRDLNLHIMFRTRQTSGTIMTVTGSSDLFMYIKIILHEGKVRLTYNLGGGNRYLELTEADANNGEWHTLEVQRYDSEFHLKMDGGEGRNYAYTLGFMEDNDVFPISRDVFAGGVLEPRGNARDVYEDLQQTCIQDVRVDNGYFGMTHADNEEPYVYGKVVINPNTKEGCENDVCQPDSCPVSRPCIELWGRFECGCKPGYRLENNQCVTGCTPSPCFGNSTCSIKEEVGVVCICPPGWTGDYCDELAPEEVVSADMTNSALAAIIVSVIVVILLALLVLFLWWYCPRGDDGEKYILEVDPEDDIRENVMNYDEEGAGEEDQDAYDISRLQKPNYESPHHPFDPMRRTDMPRTNAAPDKPDVGNFIDGRMKDADTDDNAPPYDSVREYDFEGGDSVAGSLSSLNTSSSDRSQDYDYLNDWGPKFSKLADLYGAGQELED